jgi:hypothetical protein
MFSMKNVKYPAIGLATAIIAVLCIGATPGGDQRPAQVPSEKWIAISDRAGFVVTISKRSESVGAELYLKTEQGWCRARVENPFHTYGP